MTDESRKAVDQLEKIAQQASDRGVTDERAFVDLVVEAAGTILADRSVKPPQQIAIQRVAWTLIERKGEGAEAAIEDIQYIREQLPSRRVARD